MGSISCHITPIVINSLGGGHTHTHKYTHTHTHTHAHTHTNTYTEVRIETILKNEACGRRVPGLKTYSSWLHMQCGKTMN